MAAANIRKEDPGELEKEVKKEDCPHEVRPLEEEATREENRKRRREKQQQKREERGENLKTPLGGAPPPHVFGVRALRALQEVQKHCTVKSGVSCGRG